MLNGSFRLHNSTLISIFYRDHNYVSVTAECVNADLMFFNGGIIENKQVSVGYVLVPTQNQHVNLNYIHTYPEICMNKLGLPMVKDPSSGCHRLDLIAHAICVRVNCPNRRRLSFVVSINIPPTNSVARIK